MSLLSTGLCLDDRYTVVDRLGAGGMSEVWRATDELLGRQVAVKVLAAPLADDPALREVIRREARAAARLTHPHVTAVHDYGEATLPDGRVLPYLVMELVPGRTLADRLAREGPLPWPEAVRIAGQVAAALTAAHALGVVHRDVKPANVMLADGGVKVLDFGVAAVAGGVDTDPGRLLGTPRYVAPERLDPTRPAAPAGDLYSLGVLLYEAIVGRPPVPIVDWAQAARVHRDGFTPPRLDVPGLPTEVARLYQACLSPEPERRPEAATAARVLTGLDPGAPTRPVPETPGPAAPGSPTRPAPAGSAPVAATRVDPELPTRPADPGHPGETVADLAAVAGAAPAPPPGDGAGVLRYAMGAAPLPTRPDPPPAPSEPQAGRSGRRLLRAGLAVAAVAVLLALTVLIGNALRPSGGDPDLAGDRDADPPAAPEQPADQPGEGPAGNPFPGAVGVIQALDRAVAEGEDSGRITPDAAEELRDCLGKLREAVAERDPEEFTEVVDELWEEIGELRAEGELDPQAAEELTGLLSELSIP